MNFAKPMVFAVLLGIACGSPEPAPEPESSSVGSRAEPAVAAPAEPAIPTSAEPAPRVGIASSHFGDAAVELRYHPSAAELELLRGAHLTTPRGIAGARVGTDGDRITWIVYLESESLERWALARTNGTYDAERTRVEALVSACQANSGDCFECPDCSTEDDERRPGGLHLRLARLSTTADATAIDGSVELAASEQSVVIRQVRDLDGDGHLELSLALEASVDTGQSGAGSTLFRWLDGDTLHTQLDIEHDAWAFGCNGGLSERSGFTMRDRNGDGHDDVGVRHWVWVNGCEEEGDDEESDLSHPSDRGTRLPNADMVRTFFLEGFGRYRLLDGNMVELDMDDPRWPRSSAIECPFFEERLRYFYDVVSDTWRP